MAQKSEMERLEGFVSTLLEKFNGLQEANRQLTEQLERREATIETLQDELATLKNERGEISGRVSSLLGKIEEWEATSGVAMEQETSTGGGNSSESGVQGNLFSVEAHHGFRSE